MHFIPAFAVLAAALFPAVGLAMPVGFEAASANAGITANAGEVIPDSYIVVLKDGITHDKFQAHQEWAQELHSKRLARRDDKSLTGINHGFHFGGLYGYAGAFDNNTIADIQAADEVAYIEEDKIMVAYDLEVQSSPPSWGLSRISVPNAAYDDHAYIFDRSAGEGVNVYVLDTGVNINHQDFEGRAVWGTNVADDNDNDSQGHGTHVSGTIAGASFGVAKKANIIAVKVLGDNGSGSISKVIAGIQWTVAHSKTGNNLPTKSVVNMSLGGGYSDTVNRAVEAATRQGITFAVAAGNDGKNAINYSPASSPNAITVGATDNGDVRASYSNFGPVVDVFAPGSKITSAWIGTTSGSHVLSGTSMASPHVAGLAAYLIAAEGIQGPAQITARIKQLAQPNTVKNPGPGTPDIFVWNGAYDTTIQPNATQPVPVAPLCSQA